MTSSIDRYYLVMMSYLARSRKFVKSINTSDEDKSSFTRSEEEGKCNGYGRLLYLSILRNNDAISAESEEFEDDEKKEPSSHSSDTSYGVESLPKIKVP